MITEYLKDVQKDDREFMTEIVLRHIPLEATYKDIEKILKNIKVYSPLSNYSSYIEPIRFVVYEPDTAEVFTYTLQFTREQRVWRNAQVDFGFTLAAKPFYAVNYFSYLVQHILPKIRVPAKSLSAFVLKDLGIYFASHIPSCVIGEVEDVIKVNRYEYLLGNLDVQDISSFIMERSDILQTSVLNDEKAQRA